MILVSRNKKYVPKCKHRVELIIEFTKRLYFRTGGWSKTKFFDGDGRSENQTCTTIREQGVLFDVRQIACFACSDTSAPEGLHEPPRRKGISVPHLGLPLRKSKKPSIGPIRTKTGTRSTFVRHLGIGMKRTIRGRVFACLL